MPESTKVEAKPTKETKDGKEEEKSDLVSSRELLFLLSPTIDFRDSRYCFVVGRMFSFTISHLFTTFLCLVSRLFYL